MRKNRSSFRFRSSRMLRCSFSFAHDVDTSGNIKSHFACDVPSRWRISIEWALRAITLSGLISMSPAALAQTARTETTDFLVGDIRVEGLQRISEGTVFNYLPINIGHHVDRRRIQEAVRALYATKFFQDIELRRD